jgi:hypothetical protein
MLISLKLLLFGLMLLLLFACNEPQTNTNQDKVQPAITTIDTLIGKRIITNEIAGTNYRKKATGYYLIVNNDTSDFVSIFSESIDGKVSISFFLDEASKTYATRMAELDAILPTAFTGGSISYITSSTYITNTSTSLSAGMSNVGFTGLGAFAKTSINGRPFYVFDARNLITAP